MPIPDLVAGGILPTGIYDCNLAEIHAAFVYNNRRETIWNTFLQYLTQVAAAIPELDPVYVDGSFITDKESFADNNEPPKDVDIVLEFSDFGTLNVRWLQHRFGLFDTTHAKDVYNVDLWFADAQGGMPNDLRAYFQYLRPEEAIARNLPAGTEKGILRISLNYERQQHTI